MKVHRACLQRYCYIFDEMIFVVACEDIKDTDTIDKGLKWILSINGGINCTIKIKKNTEKYSADTFKEEILDKRETYDGYVFFAQSKGVTNVTTDKFEISKYSILKWICAIYFYSMEFMPELEDKFCGHLLPNEMFYGPLLTQCQHPEWNRIFTMNKAGLYYNGECVWMNMPKFNNYINRGMIELPIVDSRYYVEMFPGTICGRDQYGDGISSHNDTLISDDFNFYLMNEEGWSFLENILGNKEEFVKMSEEMMKDIAL